jgi:hypothetical protein
MNISNEKAMRLALEAYCKTLHPLWNTGISRAEAEGFFNAGFKAAEALAKQSDSVEQRSDSEHLGEPVAWRAPNWGHSADDYVYRDFDDPVIGADGKPSPNNEPLYTTPYVLCSCGTAEGRQQRPSRSDITWVGLNNDDWIRIYNHADKSTGRAAELAEEILKEKNI